MKIPPLWCVMGLLCVCLGGTAQSQAAPTRSVSYSTWLLEGDLVTARLELPAAEAAALVGKAMPLLSTESLAEYVLKHVSVTASGSACEPTDQGYDIGRINSLSLGSNIYGYEIIFRCAQGGPRSLHNALLFAEAPQHVDFARIERGGVHATQVFTAAHQDLSIPDGGELPAAGVSRFLQLGAGHVWHSASGLCALLGFFVLARTRRRLITVIAALAVGYAASLLLVAAGLLPEVALLDCGVGFVVACIAAVMVMRSLQRQEAGTTPPAIMVGACVVVLGILLFGVAAAALHRSYAALGLSGFGIIGVALLRGGGSLPILMLPALAGMFDGWVLPGDYERLRQWNELSPANLAAFDAGALLSAALLLAAFAAAAVFMAGRAVRYRTGAETLAPLAADVAASVFAGLGSFWLLSGLH